MQSDMTALVSEPLWNMIMIIIYTIFEAMQEIFIDNFTGEILL